MRLIDAHALIDEINDMWQNHKVYLNNEPVVHFGAVIDLIGAASVIEAKPIVHAHWDQIANGFMVCSHCEEIVEENRKYSFCPLCGAQMDEGVKIPVISMEDVPKLAKEMEK